MPNTQMQYTAILTNGLAASTNYRIDLSSKDPVSKLETYQIVLEAASVLKTLRFFIKPHPRNPENLIFTLRATREEFGEERSEWYPTYQLRRVVVDTPENRDWISTRITHAVETLKWGNAM